MFAVISVFFIDDRRAATIERGTANAVPLLKVARQP